MEPTPLSGAEEWLRASEAFWNGRLDALEAALRPAGSITEGKDEAQ
jgi:hypothetical protein